MPVPENIKKKNKLIKEGNLMKYMTGKFKKSDGTEIEVFLHEAEWVLKNGLIPKNKLISHIDGNTMNNQLYNLELVDENSEFGDLHVIKPFHKDTADIVFIKNEFPDIWELHLKKKK
jgi:hypothetical protein